MVGIKRNEGNEFVSIVVPTYLVKGRKSHLEPKHLLEKKTSKRKANLSRKMVVFKGDAIAVRSMIPYA